MDEKLQRLLMRKQPRVVPTKAKPTSFYPDRGGVLRAATRGRPYSIGLAVIIAQVDAGLLIA